MGSFAFQGQMATGVWLTIRRLNHVTGVLLVTTNPVILSSSFHPLKTHRLCLTVRSYQILMHAHQRLDRNDHSQETCTPFHWKRKFLDRQEDIQGVDGTLHMLDQFLPTERELGDEKECPATSFTLSTRCSNKIFSSQPRFSDLFTSLCSNLCQSFFQSFDNCKQVKWNWIKPWKLKAPLSWVVVVVCWGYAALYMFRLFQSLFQQRYQSKTWESLVKRCLVWLLQEFFFLASLTFHVHVIVLSQPSFLGLDNKFSPVSSYPFWIHQSVWN